MSSPVSDTEVSATQQVRGHVHNAITRLQVSRKASSTVATLAHLRDNLGSAPGTDPRIWAVTIGQLPGSTTHEGPTAAEYAVHGALTLYSHHQRALDEAMYVPASFKSDKSESDSSRPRDTRFGAAVQLLEFRLGGGSPDQAVSPLRRRFDSAVLSSDVPTLLSRLRSIIGQMRSEKVPLDYAALAVDLFRWQYPGGADDVRRNWARQYYRTFTEFTDSIDTKEK